MLLPRKWRLGRSSTAATGRQQPAASLRQHHQQLTQQLHTALTAPDASPQQQVSAAHELVLEGVAALTASRDWQQLIDAFGAAAREVGAAPTARGPPASSPWGFAIRQPRQQQTAAAAGPAAAAGGSWPSRAQSQQTQTQTQHQWSWSAVRRLVLFGLGRLRGTTPTQHQGADKPAPSPRLHFRLAQLVLAKALQDHLLAGCLTEPPATFDPAADAFDAALASSLGWQVLQQADLAVDLAADLAVAGSSQTLLYMPCCPRDLYSKVVAANIGQLHRLAIFGTSMRSLADTNALVEALTTGPLEAAGQLQQLPSGPGGAADALQLLYQTGGVVERTCPDCAAHGVGVAVHLFKQR